MNQSRWFPRYLLSGVFVLGLGVPIRAADFFWVAENAGAWSAAAHWVTTSGGAKGAGVPGVEDRAIFDAGSVDAEVDSAYVGVIGSILVKPGYHGVITQARDLRVKGDFTLDGGSETGWTFRSATTEAELKEDLKKRDLDTLDPEAPAEEPLLTGEDTPATLTVDGTLTITAGHLLLCPRSATEGEGKGRTLSIGKNLVVHGALSADGQGLRVGPGTPKQPVAPDQNRPISSAGAGHGGRGGYIGSGDQLWVGGVTYGSITAPLELGCGAPRVDLKKIDIPDAVGNSPVDNWTGQISAGGGAITLTVGGATTVTGRISANGRMGDTGTSGGSIYLTSATLDGAGVISADGSNGPPYGWGRGCGGGGRVAVVLRKGTMCGQVKLQAYGGTGRFSPPAAAGTIYLQVAGEAKGTLIIDNNGSQPRSMLESATVVCDRGAQDYQFSAVHIRNAGVLVLDPDDHIETPLLSSGDPNNAGGAVLVCGVLTCPTINSREQETIDDMVFGNGAARTATIYALGQGRTLTGERLLKCFTVGYLPSYRKVTITGNLAAFPHPDLLQEYTGATVGVYAPTQPTALATGTLTFNAQRAGVLTLNVPDLADGTYTVRIRLGGKLEVPPLTFARKKFPWEGNTIGITDKVYPPFEPLVVKGNELQLAQRVYRLNGFGLFDEVVAKSRNILAAPITLKLETAQGLQQWTFGDGKFSTVKPNVVVYDAVATADPVQVTTRNTVEFDGCAKVEMTLAPGVKPGEITRLWVEIPFKDTEVPLFHDAAFEGMRRDYVGSTPRGGKITWGPKPGAWIPPTWSVEKGAEGQDPAVIWTAADTRPWSHPTVNDFVPYIWLGAVERGLAWFAANDKGWVPDNSKPAQVITREGDRVVLRIYLINRPVTLTEPHALTFGLQASPTRPMPADFRTVDYMGTFPWGAMTPFGGKYCSDKYPLDRDFSLVDNWLAERQKAKPDYTFFTKKVNSLLAREAWPAPYTPQAWLKIWEGTFATRHGMSIYFEEHWTNPIHEEFDYFKDEWFGGGETYCRSHVDFCLYYAHEYLKRGFSLYFDNTMLNTTNNTLVNDAYETTDGRIQPSTSIWEKREYYQRIWNALNEENALGKHPRLNFIQHMTNELILPHGTWATTTMDNEWSWCDAASGHYPAIFPPEVLQAEMMGRQTGTQGAALYPIGAFDMSPGAPPPGKPRDIPVQYARREWGMRVVHEIFRSPEHQTREESILRQYGYGKPGCRVVNYWEDAPPITVDNPQVKWLGVMQAQGGTGELVLQSYAPTAQTARIHFPEAHLLLDVATRESFPLDANGNGAVPIPADYGTRVLLVGAAAADLPAASPQGAIFFDDFECGFNPLWPAPPNYFSLLQDPTKANNHLLQVERSREPGGPYPTFAVTDALLSAVPNYELSMKVRIPLLPTTPNDPGTGSIVFTYGLGTLGDDPAEAPPDDPDAGLTAGATHKPAKKVQFGLRLDVNTVDDKSTWACSLGRGAIDMLECGTFWKYETNLLTANRSGLAAVLPQLGPATNGWHTLKFRVQGGHHVLSIDDHVFLDGQTDAVCVPRVMIATPHGGHAEHVEIDDLTLLVLPEK